MNLSPKAVRFVVEALDFYVQDQDQRLRRSEASDDQLADWENDRHFIEAIKQDCLDQATQQLTAGEFRALGEAVKQKCVDQVTPQLEAAHIEA